jgi:hypothetical protein
MTGQAEPGMRPSHLKANVLERWRPSDNEANTGDSNVWNLHGGWFGRIVFNFPGHPRIRRVDGEAKFTMGAVLARLREKEAATQCPLKISGPQPLSQPGRHGE